ncbi:MAG: hypothetical protein SGJ04_08295 [Bacteroidota bacterium]|nr:hypothetical protein [Bacteroidota bacterium]
MLYLDKVDFGFSWELLALLLLVYFVITPLVAGHYADTHGHSFWLWWGLGLVLPVVSIFILLFLPDKSELGKMEHHKRMLKKRKRRATIPEQIMLEVDFILKYHNTKPEEEKNSVEEF